MRADSFGPSPAIGSSSSSRRGVVASAIAISICRCSPWLRRETAMPARSSMPTRSSAARAGSRSSGSRAHGLPEAEGMTGMGLYGERDIVERGEIRKQRSDLERARQPQQAAPPDRQRGDVVRRRRRSFRHRARVRRPAGRSGWSCPRRSARSSRAARRSRNIERHIVGGDHAAEALVQALDLQQRFSHGQPSSAAP